MDRVIQFVKLFFSHFNRKIVILLGDMPTSELQDLYSLYHPKKLVLFHVNRFLIKAKMRINGKARLVILPFPSFIITTCITYFQSPILFIGKSISWSRLSRLQKHVFSTLQSPLSFFLHVYSPTDSLTLDAGVIGCETCLFKGHSQAKDYPLEIEIFGNFNTQVILNHSKPVSVVAIMTAFNEDDIIEHSLQHLISQGIDVYLIDNWSTDRTFEKASHFLGKGVIGIEKFPSDGPSQYYQWGELLKRVVSIASTLSHDWIIHHDADEMRYGPFRNISLKQSFQIVDVLGYTAVDHCLLNFHPIDNGYTSDISPENYFRFFTFGASTDAPQIKAWKNQNSSVQLAISGGHFVHFEGIRVFPFQFMIKHYRIRSDEHGRKKVFQDRKSRWDPTERQKGWHVQYDDIQESTSFIKSPEQCILFDSETFYRDYLIERLTWL